MFLRFLYCIYKVGAISFEVIHYNQISIQTWIQFGISVFYHFIPFKSEVVDKFCTTKISEEDLPQISYDQCKLDFMTVDI